MNVELRAREFALLQHLLMTPDRVWTRAELLESVWGVASPGEVLTRTVDIHIQRLRRKLGKEGRRIRTVYRVG